MFYVIFENSSFLCQSIAFVYTVFIKLLQHANDDVTHALWRTYRHVYPGSIVFLSQHNGLMHVKEGALRTNSSHIVMMLGYSTVVLLSSSSLALGFGQGSHHCTLMQCEHIYTTLFIHLFTWHPFIQANQVRYLAQGYNGNTPRGI